MGGLCSAPADIQPIVPDEVKYDYHSVDFTSPYRAPEFAVDFLDLVGGDPAKRMPYSTFRLAMRKAYNYVTLKDIDTLHSYIASSTRRQRQPGESARGPAHDDSVGLMEYIKFGYLLFRFHEILAEPRRAIYYYADENYNCYAYLTRVQSLLAYHYSLDKKDMRYIFRVVRNDNGWINFQQWAIICEGLDSLQKLDKPILYDNQARRAAALKKAFDDKIKERQEAEKVAFEKYRSKEKDDTAVLMGEEPLDKYASPPKEAEEDELDRQKDTRRDARRSQKSLSDAEKVKARDGRSQTTSPGRPAQQAGKDVRGTRPPREPQETKGERAVRSPAQGKPAAPAKSTLTAQPATQSRSSLHQPGMAASPSGQRRQPPSQPGMQTMTQAGGRAAQASPGVQPTRGLGKYEALEAADRPIAQDPRRRGPREAQDNVDRPVPEQRRGQPRAQQQSYAGQQRALRRYAEPIESIDNSSPMLVPAR